MYNRIRLWEPWLVQYIPQQGDVALDVGAANGTWTLDLADRFELVMAFEPHAEAFRELRTRLASESSAEAYITTFNYAVSNQVGQRAMHLHEHPDHTSFFDEGEI